VTLRDTKTQTDRQTEIQTDRQTDRPVVALCPKTPLKNAGIRMLPPMSEPMPIADAAAD